MPKFKDGSSVIINDRLDGKEVWLYWGQPQALDGVPMPSKSIVSRLTWQELSDLTDDLIHLLSEHEMEKVRAQNAND